ncbi:hypothetical protein F4680DRAFT_413122 [Xylaria scruposa]|nr:hypothetical protein F4680DRAFT_413122 [Xylaria scruposa]
MNGLSRHSRQLIRSCWSPSLRRQAPLPISAVQRRRYSSSVSNDSLAGATDIDIEAIRAEMLARRPQVHMDIISPLNSGHLITALSEFLPKECYENQWMSHMYARKSSDYKDCPIPAGHHLVYFPLQRRGSDLCPDGTDPYHGPRDTPFTRRMWAGGSIKGFTQLSLGEGRALCLERIVDVNVRGSAGTEKIFVEVLREYVNMSNTRTFGYAYDPHLVRLRPFGIPPGHHLTAAYRPLDPRKYKLNGITERRTLVFMREPSDEEKKTNLEQKQRVVKASTNPDYSVTLTPTPALLFHYSALTYNAHRIHLDRSYCREVEGHRDLLVHGPLSLTLMLSVLQSQLDINEFEFIDNIDYRHLAPLYVGQPMRVCVKLQKPRAGEKDTANGTEIERRRWDLWVENQDRSLCVRGTAETAKPAWAKIVYLLDKNIE